MMRIEIPQDAGEILRALEADGHEAYLIGGCVRDMLLGKYPHDIDITTSARPERVMEIFGERAFPTGLKHGTVTVKQGGENIEVTTYRSDLDYEDHRHPKKVTFSDTLADDISRRDLTVNALAADINGEIKDLCGGLSDLENKVLRCVGEPSCRFEEDALRIMRTLRFSSVLGFDIEKATAKALHDRKALLHEISTERITEELGKFLLGSRVTELMTEYSDIFALIVPEFAPCIGFDQMSEYHMYTVYEHIAHAVGNAPADPLVRTALFFHDIEKPSCCLFYGGRRHFTGHERAGAITAQRIMKRMRFDNDTIAKTCTLIAEHGLKPEFSDPYTVEDRIWVRHIYSRVGEELFFRLVSLSEADNRAKSPLADERIGFLRVMEQIGADIRDRGDCVSLKSLAVKGGDIKDICGGGRVTGLILSGLLDAVMDERVPNEKEPLLGLAREIFDGYKKQDTPLS